MAQQTRPGEGTTSPFATQSSPSLSPGVSVPQVSPSGQSATTSGSSESPSGSGGSGNTTTPGVFGRLLNTLRPPLNRTYTAQSGSIRKSGKATKGKRRNSSPPRPGSANSGSMQSGRDSPQASMPVRSLSAVQGETSVNDIASISDKASVLSAGSASAQGSRSPAALGRGPPGAFPASSPYASPLAPDAIIQQSLEPHSTPASPAVSPSTSPRLPTTSGATLSVQRPQPERRQSSGKRLAAALTKPLFRRSSSQTGGSGSPAAPNLSSSAASVASGSISGSGRGTASRSRPASTLGSAVQDASSVQNASSASINTRRPWTSSSARSAYSLGAQSTPSPGTETLNQQPGFPSPYFAQATPTNAYPNPFSPSVDCVQALTVLLSQQITATLAQLVPVNLFTAASGLSPQALALGSLPGLSSVSVATSALSDATTSSSAHHTAASSSNAASSSQWNSYSTGGTTVVGFGSFGFISNEQLAASSLSLPTTSVGTVWRTARAYEWLGENGAALNALAASRSNPMTPRPMSGRPSLDGQLAKQDAPDAAERQESVFDFSALVQSVLDVMASTAADAGVELTFYHGSRKADPVARRGPAEKQAASRAQPSSPSQRQTYQYDMQDSQEAFVKGDERGLGIGLVALLKQVIADSRHGASIQVGLSFALTLPPRGDRQQPDRDNEDEDADDTEEDSTPLGTYLCTVEVVHKFALPPSPSLAQPPSATQAAGPAPAKASSPGSLDPTVSAALLQFLRLSFVTLPPRSDSQAYKITCTLPQALHPLRRSPSADPSYRRRGSVSQSKEPSMQELVRFAETSLRGKKVAFHAQEQNDFAQLISYHLSHWGMECSHVAILQDEDSESGPPWDGGAAPRTRLSGLRPDERAHLGRYDSGFGGSDGQSPPTMPSPSINLSADQTAQSQAVPSSYGSRTGGSDHSHPSSAVTSPPLDPTLSFIIVDDDVPTLKRQLISVRNNVPTVQLQNALLAKRPQLQSRRTRSSQAVQRVPQTTVSIIHFTSLANYRQIRELVHATLKTASPMFPLPEVLVIPKPVGPRRLLATLYNAVRRPTLDPSFAPIATSPSSPGGQYFFAGGRPSPAPSSHLNNEFDVAAGQAVAAQRLQQQSQPHYQYYPQPQHPDAASLSAAASHISGPKTPPVPGQQLSNPPSPASPDALEYFSRSAAELGSNASQGIIIQSPDGRPTGLFFQPRAASLYDRAESLRMARGSVSDGDRTSTGSHPRGSPALSGGSGLSAGGQELPSIVIPDNMDYATGVRNLALNSPPGGTTPTPDVPKPEAAKTAEYVGTPNSDLAESLPMQLEPARPAEVPSPASSNFPNDDGSSSSGSLAQQTEIGLARVESRAESAVPEAATGPQKPLSQPSSPRLSASPKPALQRQPTAAPSPTVSKISPSLSGAAESAAKAGAGAPTKAGSSPSAPLARVKAERKSSSRGEKIKKTPSRRPTGTLVPPINVLIVEDNPINQIILSTFLKRKGIKYSVANNGQEAVDSWKGGNFHLVLMDIQLPVKDGIEATQEIRAMERAGNTQGFVSTPSATPGSELSNPISPPVSVVTSPYELPVIIVALTASSLQSDRVNALAAGCNDFLTKPVSLQWLNQKLVEWGSMAYLSGFSSKRRTTISGSVSPLSPQPGQPSIKGKQKDKEALVQKELKAVKQETEEKKEEKKELIEERKEVAEAQVKDAQDAAKEAELVEEIKDGETTLPIAGDA